MIYSVIMTSIETCWYIFKSILLYGRKDIMVYDVKIRINVYEDEEDDVPIQEIKIQSSAMNRDELERVKNLIFDMAVRPESNNE